MKFLYFNTDFKDFEINKTHFTSIFYFQEKKNNVQEKEIIKLKLYNIPSHLIFLVPKTNINVNYKSCLE